MFINNLKLMNTKQISIWSWPTLMRGGIQCMVLWGTWKMDIDFFLYSCRHNYKHFIAFLSQLTWYMSIMWSPMFEIQYDDAYVLIDAIKIISLRITKIIFKRDPMYTYTYRHVLFETREWCPLTSRNPEQYVTSGSAIRHSPPVVSTNTAHVFISATGYVGF